MKFLLALQCALGVTKILMAFSPIGGKRFAWHMVSGAAILAMGLVLLLQEAHHA